MTELKLVSPRQHALKPLVEAALQNEIRMLAAGTRRTQQRLKDFETRFGISTDEFVRSYENDELSETLEYAEWIGEFRLLNRLQEKLDTLREIRFAS